MLKKLMFSAIFTLSLALTQNLYAFNLVLNSGFESGSGTDASDWNEGSFSRTGALAHSGTFSMSMPANFILGSGQSGSAAITSSNINVTPGQSYILSGWVYNAIVGGGSAYLDLNDKPYETNIYSTSGLGQWQYISAPFIPTDSTVMVRLVVDGGQGAISQGSTAFFDDISVDVNAVPEPATLSLLGLGLLGLLKLKRKEKLQA